MNGPSKNESLFGGIDLNVTFIDGSVNPVRVRQLPVKLYPAYRSLMQNEPAMVELLCSQDRGWSDNLTIESFETIITEGERLNADFFARWVDREKKREALLPKANPEEVAAMFAMLQERQPGLVKEMMTQAGLSSQTSFPSSQ